jgi:hypothetical protein
MQRWNFNVTIPLWDWVTGTIAPREVLDDVLGSAPRCPEISSSKSEPKSSLHPS